MKLTNREWISELLQDERGHVSIKPVIAVLGSLCLFITLLLSSYIDKTIHLSDSLIQAVAFVTAIGMGADTLDKFSFKGKSRYGDEEPEYPPRNERPEYSPRNYKPEDDEPLKYKKNGNRTTKGTNP